MSWKSLPIFLLAILALWVSPAIAQQMPQKSFTSGNAEPVSDTPWWENFNDPLLTDFIKEGLSSSPDQQGTKNRIIQANAVAGRTLSPVLPQLSLEATGRLSAIESLGQNTINQLEAQGETVPDTWRSGSLMGVARLNADIFGKQSLSYVAARRDWQAAQANGDTAAMALASQIARAYYEVLAAYARFEAVKTQIDANKTLLELVELRYKRGDATGLAVLQQRQQLAGTSTLLPQAEANLKVAKQSLLVLLGRPASDELELPAKPLPDLPAQPATGTPKDLMTNQPALRSAQIQLEAEKARKNSAIVSFLPTVQLTAQAGEQATYIVDNQQEFVWEVYGTVSVPIFQGAQNIHNLRQTKAGERAAKADLRRQALQSAADVDAALIREQQYYDQYQAYKEQLASADLSLGQAKQRYLTGLEDYTTVLIAQNARQQTELSLITTHALLIQSRINLHQTLGGAWTRFDFDSVKEN